MGKPAEMKTVRKDTRRVLRINDKQTDGISKLLRPLIFFLVPKIALELCARVASCT